MQGRNREADTEERLADTGGEEREGQTGSSIGVCAPPSVKQLVGRCCVAQGAQLAAL